MVKGKQLRKLDGCDYTVRSCGAAWFALRVGKITHNFSHIFDQNYKSFVIFSYENYFVIFSAKN